MSMPEERIVTLEKSVQELQKLSYKIEASLENIEKYLSDALAVRDTVTTHAEKFKVTENRLAIIEIDKRNIEEKISTINLKIATVSGAWGVVFFGLGVFISKFMK